MKKWIDTGQNKTTKLTTLSRKPPKIVEMGNLGEKQESYRNLSENSDEHGGHVPGQCNALVNDETSEMEIEQEVECNKKESKCTELLIEIKTCEEDGQQMDGKKDSLKFFQLVVPLLK